jgi:hypothetical protein
MSNPIPSTTCPTVGIIKPISSISHVTYMREAMPRLCAATLPVALSQLSVLLFAHSVSCSPWVGGDTRAECRFTE